MSCTFCTLPCHFYFLIAVYMKEVHEDLKRNEEAKSSQEFGGCWRGGLESLERRC